MTDQQLRDTYARFLGRRRAESRASCPSLEAIDALVVRAGPESGRLATMDHVMACPDCRGEFEQLRALHAAQDRPAHVRRQLLKAAASIAVLVGAGLIWRVRQRPAPEEFRGGSDVVTLVGPSGPTPGTRPVTFAWHPASGAVDYQVELLDGDSGDILFTASGADTVLVLPDTVSLTGGRVYAWWVQARAADGSQSRSAATRFTLTNP